MTRLARSGGPSALVRVTGLAAAQFEREHWNARPRLMRSVDLPRDFTDLLGVHDVDELLGARGLRTPYFRLVQDGNSPDPRGYTRAAAVGDRRLTDLADSPRVAAQYATGATIVLNALHRTHPPLAAFCAALATELGHQVQVNAYVTPPDAQGFRSHHDTHDVFVLQLDGSKHWTVHAPLLELPLPAQPSSQLDLSSIAQIEPALDIDLHPGDALYLPRGWLHSARTTADRSIHLTVGVLQTTWFDILSDVVALAAEEPELRRALPLGDGAELTGASDLLARAAKWLADLAPERVAATVAARRVRAIPAEPVGVLAQEQVARQLTAQTAVRRRRGVPMQVEVEGDRGVLLLPDRRIALPVEYAEALRHAVSGPAVTALDLGVDVVDGLVLIRRLLREAAVVPDHR